MKANLLKAVLAAMVISQVAVNAQAATRESVEKSARTSVKAKKKSASQIRKDLSRASLEGELYLSDDGELDLGNFLVADEETTATKERQLNKLGFVLTNKRIVESGNSILAIVTEESSQTQNATQYLYFNNIAGVSFGVFKITNITVNAITIETEMADGTIGTAELRKRAGTFLPL